MRSTLVLLLVVGACGSRDQPDLKREPNAPPRRVIEPPPKGVKALPPHAIRSEGVGPYKLGETVARLLDQLPSGPRITQFTIPLIVQRDLLRAEDDAILIGAEPQGKAVFVAVVGAEIARTESGVHVGSTREQVVRGLGAPIDDPDRAQDPHILIPAGLKNLHAFIEDDRLTAMVVASEERGKDGGAESACTRPKGDRDQHKVGACLSGSGEVVRYDDDKIQVFAKDADKPFDTKPVPNLVFAAALRNPADGRDDVVAITRTADAQSKSWSLVVFRLVDNKLVKPIPDTPVFQLSAANARWIGADVRDVEIYAEITGRSDVIEVGGLLTTRSSDKIRDIVVISPFPVSRRRAKPAAQDAGTTETRGDGTDRATR